MGEEGIVNVRASGARVPGGGRCCCSEILIWYEGEAATSEEASVRTLTRAALVHTKRDRDVMLAASRFVATQLTTISSWSR